MLDSVKEDLPFDTLYKLEITVNQAQGVIDYPLRLIRLLSTS